MATLSENASISGLEITSERVSGMPSICDGSSEVELMSVSSCLEEVVSDTNVQKMTDKRRRGTLNLLYSVILLCYWYSKTLLVALV